MLHHKIIKSCTSPLSEQSHLFAVLLVNDDITPKKLLHIQERLHTVLLQQDHHTVPLLLLQPRLIFSQLFPIRPVPPIKTSPLPTELQIIIFVLIGKHQQSNTLFLCFQSLHKDVDVEFANTHDELGDEFGALGEVGEWLYLGGLKDDFFPTVDIQLVGPASVLHGLS